MKEFLFQPFSSNLLNLVLSFTFLYAVFYCAMNYLKINIYLSAVLILEGLILTVYAHQARDTNGYSIGILIGIALSIVGSIQLGKFMAEKSNKK